MTGRPTKLTPETQKKLIDAIALGASYEDAALHAGIAYNTFLNWRKRGAAEKTGEFVAFLQTLRQAEARGKIGLLTIIERSARAGDWRAAAWKLERRDPEGYGLTQKHRVGGDPDGVPIETHGTFTIQIDSRRGEDADDDRPADDGLDL